jgi:hypothetical protein
MIGVTSERSEELLPLRVRLRGVGTNDEQTERRDHQPGWQIHLTDQEICPKNRSHPCIEVTLLRYGMLWRDAWHRGVRERIDPHERDLTTLVS